MVQTRLGLKNWVNLAHNSLISVSIHRDRLSSDDFIGTAFLELNDISSRGDAGKWCYLISLFTSFVSINILL